MTPELNRHLERLAKMRSPAVSTILSRHCYRVEAEVLRAIETELAAQTTVAPTGAILTERELATVLAALRHWQARGCRSIPTELKDYFIEHEPLRSAAIDRLCERLNSGG